jgi:drug/metabolite transporter (DMT)-like permease
MLWGGSFLFYRMLATALPPLTTVLSRVAIGALAIGAAMLLRGISWRIPRDRILPLAGLALLNNVVPFALFAWAETRVTGGTASILNAMTPIFTVLISGLILRTERLTASRIAGVLCGLAGVLTLVGPQALLGADLLGQAACLLAAVCYGFALPLGRRITGVAPEQMATAQLALSSLIVLPLVLLLDQPWTLPALTPDAWIAVLGLGLLSTGLAYVIFFALLSSAGATNLSLVTLLVPVSALLLGHVVLAEPITWQAVAGMALIGAGLAAIDGRLLRAMRTSR